MSLFYNFIGGFLRTFALANSQSDRGPGYAALSRSGLITAICFMPHNPFAWAIFALTFALMLAHAVKGIKRTGKC